MRAVLQRVNSASVHVENNCIGEINRGLLIFLGIEDSDQEADLQYTIKKILALRIFADLEGKMNLSLQDIKGEILIVSQFTLIADTENGNRPSFFRAAKPEKAIPFYEKAIVELAKSGLKLQTGKFGADMQVRIENDGPVTIVLDTCSLNKFPS